MKPNFLILLFLCFSYVLNGQVSDPFEDANFTNPFWQADTAKFTFESGKLRSSSSSANDEFSISTSINNTTEFQWELDVELLFSTSSKNYIDFYLRCDSSQLLNAKNGYFIRVGDTKDHLAFWKKENGADSKLFNTADGSISGGSSTTSIKVLLLADSTFQLLADFTGKRQYTLVWEQKQSQLLMGDYSGILIAQSTSSFFQKHYFDDFYAGPIVLDKTAPKVVLLEQRSLTTLELSFDEAVDTNQVRAGSTFSIDKGIGNSVGLEFLSEKAILLEFAQMANPEQYQLRVQNVSDKEGNTLLDTSLKFSSILAKEPSFLDLVINEFMFTPDPPVQLPAVEFVELYNRSDEPIAISNLLIADASTEKSLNGDYLLSEEYAIVCSEDDSALFSGFGKVLTVDGLPSLNNSGDVISLRTNEGKIIHEVSYHSGILPVEKQSGWSVELKDHENPCNFENNWGASIDVSGGTPGKINSIYQNYPDDNAPHMLRAFPKTDSTLEVVFNEYIPTENNLLTNNFVLLETAQNPLELEGGSEANTFELSFQNRFAQGTLYHLVSDGIMDCVGNERINDTVSFALPQMAEEGDLKFNEILYSPFEGGSEYLELYNSSDKYLDLSRIQLAKREDGIVIDSDFLTSEGHLLAPGSFVVLSKEVDKISPFYQASDSSTFVESSGLLSLNNDETELVLLNIQNDELESVVYSPDWHYELVREEKGVSLERISLDLGNSSHNWTSAAESAGFGTPGVPNSQMAQIRGDYGSFDLEYKSFSPNGDGYRDVLRVLYNGVQPNTAATLKIFTDRGMLVKTVSNNETLSSTGSITWKGETEEGSKAPIGIYVVYIEYFTPDGKVEKKKLSCALVRE